ncbi:hypothetical protein ACQP3J_32725, partial [Escherichia coli]
FVDSMAYKTLMTLHSAWHVADACCALGITCVLTGPARIQSMYLKVFSCGCLKIGNAEAAFSFPHSSLCHM